MDSNFQQEKQKKKKNIQIEDEAENSERRLKFKRKLPFTVGKWRKKNVVIGVFWNGGD